MTKIDRKFSRAEMAEHHAEELRKVLKNTQEQLRSAREEVAKLSEPIPLILTCPACGARHIDEGEFAVKLHHTHACQGCGMVWRPAIQPTVGVRFLAGFKNVRERLSEVVIYDRVLSAKDIESMYH